MEYAASATIAPRWPFLAALKYLRTRVGRAGFYGGHSCDHDWGGPQETRPFDMRRTDGRATRTVESGRPAQQHAE